MFSYQGNLAEGFELVSILNSMASRQAINPMPQVYRASLSENWNFYYDQAVQSRMVIGNSRTRSWSGRSPKRDTGPAWKSRYTTGDIVCSEYFRYSVKAEGESRKVSKPIYIGSHPSNYLAWYLPRARTGRIRTIETDGQTSLGKTYSGTIPQEWWPYVSNSILSYDVGRKMLTTTGHVNDLGIVEDVGGKFFYTPESAEPVADVPELPFNPIQFSPVPPEAINKVANRLKEGEVDLLTELAELRSTVQGLSSNVYRTYTYMKDLQRLKSRAGIVRALKQLANADPDLGSLKLFQKKLRKEQRRFDNDRKHTSRKYGSDGSAKAVDRLTNHWLDAQYGIGPVLYLIKDQINNLSESKRVYIRARTTWSEEVSLTIPPGWTVVSNTLKCERAVWAKARLSYDSLYDHLRSYYSGNLLHTAWELYPFSFVYDWVTKLGDVLSTIDFDAQHLQTVFQSSSKVTGELVLQKIDPNGQTTTVRYHGFGYNRRMVNPDDRFLTLSNPLKWEVSAKNWVTAFSLIWQRLRGNKISRNISNG